MTLSTCYGPFLVPKKGDAFDRHITGQPERFFDQLVGDLVKTHLTVLIEVQEELIGHRRQNSVVSATCAVVGLDRICPSIDAQQFREKHACTISAAFYRPYRNLTDCRRFVVGEARRADEQQGLTLIRGNFARAAKSSLNAKRPCCWGADVRLST